MKCDGQQPCEPCQKHSVACTITAGQTPRGRKRRAGTSTSEFSNTAAPTVNIENEPGAFPAINGLAPTQASSTGAMEPYQNIPSASSASVTQYNAASSNWSLPWPDIVDEPSAALPWSHFADTDLMAVFSQPLGLVGAMRCCVYP